MPYLDIVFHNIRAGGALRVGPANSRAYYTRYPTLVNVCQTPAGAGGALVPRTMLGGGYASLGWGANIAGALGRACGMFFCESSPYTVFPGSLYNPNWGAAMPAAAPAFPTVALNAAVPVGPGPNLLPPNPAPNPAPPNSIGNSFTPWASAIHLCAFLEGYPDTAPPPIVPLAPASANWLVKSNPNCPIRCIGTGDPTAPLYGAAPPGSDRYAIYFQATNRTYNALGNPISGLFVHTKNTAADPGTQITALCRQFPNSVIFGDLNFDITNALKLQSLNASINGTHTVLAIQQAVGGPYYKTHKTMANWNSCLDYALVPNAFTGHVEIWGYKPGAIPVLHPNGSDHSVMMLRIFCN
jgi:hypothetical protein